MTIAVREPADRRSSEADRDSLHILPLATVPVQTPALRRARLIKNVRLRSVVEFFADAQTGSGQLDVADLGKALGWADDGSHPDTRLLGKLAGLPSYDVYSLRILLRELGIPVNDADGLKLSARKRRELGEYMTSFTRPLIVQIYGGNDVSIRDFGDVVALFKDTDVSIARQKLAVIADKLEVGLHEVPKFLEDYGDIFLSLSYYRQCLDRIEPIFSQFLESLDGIRGNWQLKRDRNLMRSCALIEATFNGLMAAVTGRLENFDRSTADMWNEITAERFRKVEALIKSYHTTIGGALCALGVKLDAWARLFPTPETGGPVRHAEFIMSEMRQGIENIRKIEDSASTPSELA